MPQNPVVRLIAAVALLLAVVAALLLYTPLGRQLWQGAGDSGVALIGGPFHLTDQNGQIRREADFRGQFTLVFFGYSNCPDVCPTTLQTITTALDKLGPDAAKVTPIFITVDPERDTPALLAEYVTAFEPTFLGLTGDSPATRRAARAFKVFYQKVPTSKGDYTMDHSTGYYVIDRKGRTRLMFRYGQSAADMAYDIRLLLRE